MGQLHDAYRRLQAARKKAAAISDPAAKRKAEVKADEIAQKEVITALVDEANWDEADRIAAQEIDAERAEGAPVIVVPEAAKGSLDRSGGGTDKGSVGG